MKRFIKIFVLLIVCLFVVVSGVDATLDHMSHSATQNSFVWYTDKGESVFVYHGDLALCQSYTKPTSSLHRMSARSSTELF